MVIPSNTHMWVYNGLCHAVHTSQCSLVEVLLRCGVPSYGHETLHSLAQSQQRAFTSSMRHTPYVAAQSLCNAIDCRQMTHWQCAGAGRPPRPLGGSAADAAGVVCHRALASAAMTPEDVARFPLPGTNRCGSGQLMYYLWSHAHKPVAQYWRACVQIVIMSTSRLTQVFAGAFCAFTCAALPSIA